MALIVGAMLVSASGAATTKAQKTAKIDVSTRAAVIHYLRSIHVSAKGVVIQRGLRNYAGRHCPGKAWTCAGTRHTVVQIAKRGGLNRFACGTAKCAVVQFASGTRGLKAASRSPQGKPPPPPPNTALCVKTTGITQSCVINQPSATGTNKAVVWMVTPKLTGLTQSASYSASITQGPASATGSSNINLACVNQGVTIDGSTTSSSGSVTVTNDAHQSISIQQNSLTGSNTVRGATQSGSSYDCGGTSSSLTQLETLTSTVTGKGSIKQLQDTAVGTPNVLLDIEQNQNAAGGFKGNPLATAPNSASFVQTSHMTAIANTPKGPVTQTQSSPDDAPPFSGLVAAINQDSTGVSTASATQIETQCEDAATGGLTACATNTPDILPYSLTQTQYGPEGIFHSAKAAQGRTPYAHKTPGDSFQTGNGADTFTIVQQSNQDNDTNSGQKNTIAGGITTDGSGTVNQNALIQGNPKADVQTGTGTNISSFIHCTGSTSASCTKTLSKPKITGDPGSPVFGTDASTFTFTNSDPTAAFSCSLDGVNYSPCNGVGSQTYSASSLPSGSHTFYVKTRDADNGDLSAGFDSFTWVITPPDPTISSGPDPQTTSTDATFAFADADSTAKFECKLDSAASYSACPSSNPTYSGLSHGPHTLDVKATDSSGNYESNGFAEYDWEVIPYLTFETTDDGAAAGWSGIPGLSPITLTTGSDPGTYAQFTIHDSSSLLVDDLAEPTFTTDTFSGGAPRYEIDFADGDYAFGYPAQQGWGTASWDLNCGGGIGCAAMSNVSWSAIQGAETGQTVTDALIEADFPTNATYNVTDFTFDGYSLSFFTN